jgi:hypothetical protein
MARESKISSTQIDETSPETLIHLSYQSMIKETSFQRYLKQHSWRHKHIYIHYATKPRGPKITHALGSIARVKISRKQVDSQRRGSASQ